MEETKMRVKVSFFPFLKYVKYFSVMFIESVLTQRSNVVDHRDSVVTPDLEHPVHQLPLSGEGVKLQDIIKI